MVSTSGNYDQHFGDTISTVEDVQYCEGIPSVLWRIFNTVEGNHNYCGGSNQSTYGFPFQHCTPSRILHIPYSTPHTFSRVIRTAEYQNHVLLDLPNTEFHK